MHGVVVTLANLINIIGTFPQTTASRIGRQTRRHCRLYVSSCLLAVCPIRTRLVYVYYFLACPLAAALAEHRQYRQTS